MNIEKQYFFIKNINRLLNNGYSLNNSFDMLLNIYPKEIKKIKLGLESGKSLAQVIKSVKLSRFVYEAILIGEKSNKINEIFSLIEKQFSFYLKLKKIFNNFLLYPLILIIISLISFELIKINVYPIINILIQNYSIKQNRFLVFIAFNLIKIIGGVIVVIIFLLYIYKPLGNLIPLIKKYRLLVLLKYIEVLLTCGNSLDEAIQILNTGFNKVYCINDLEYVLLNEDDKSNLLTPFDKSFYTYFKQGIINNDLLTAIKDYCFFHEDLLSNKLSKFTHYIQFILFIIVAVNIFLIYYVVMIPILQISEYI